MPAQTYNWVNVIPPDSHLTRLHFNPEGDTLYAGLSTGYGILSLHTHEWIKKEVPDFIGREVWSLSTVPGRYSRVITGRQNAFFKGYLEKNDDFSIIGTILFNSEGGGFTDVRYMPDHPDTLLACGWSDITPGDLLRSEDGGSTWYQLQNYHHTAMTGIALNPASPGEIYISGNAKITRSSDYGNTWAIKDTGLPSTLGCYTVDSDPHNPAVILTSNDNGIYRSDDAGSAWKQVYSRTCRRIVFHPAVTGLAAAITFQPYRILLTTDSGLNWHDATSNYRGTGVVDAAFSKYDNMLYAASYASGIFRANPFPDDASDKDNLIPSDFSLKQNYPNPFNPSTTIDYCLPATSNVKIKVYDMLGNRVAELVNETKEAGYYSVSFNASALSSGVYICRIEAGNYRAVKKMTQIK